MSASSVVERIEAAKLVAVVRAPSPQQALDICRALIAGGVNVLEITFTVPNAVDVIRAVHEELATQCVLGAGTVLDTETGRIAMLAGAEFIVSPTLNLELIQLCKRYGKAVMPGAYTPTEILTAWQAGADIVKVFPADIGGPAFFKAVRGPLPQVKLMPTGGVNLETARAFLDAGACALGAGGSLIPKAAVASGDMALITQTAKEFVACVG